MEELFNLNNFGCQPQAEIFSNQIFQSANKKDNCQDIIFEKFEEREEEQDEMNMSFFDNMEDSEINEDQEKQAQQQQIGQIIENNCDNLSNISNKSKNYFQEILSDKQNLDFNMNMQLNENKSQNQSESEKNKKQTRKYMDKEQSMKVRKEVIRQIQFKEYNVGKLVDMGCSKRYARKILKNYGEYLQNKKKGRKNLMCNKVIYQVKQETRSYLMQVLPFRFSNGNIKNSPIKELNQILKKFGESVQFNKKQTRYLMQNLESVREFVNSEKQGAQISTQITQDQFQEEKKVILKQKQQEQNQKQQEKQQQLLDQNEDKMKIEEKEKEKEEKEKEKQKENQLNGWVNANEFINTYQCSFGENYMETLRFGEREIEEFYMSEKKNLKEIEKQGEIQGKEMKMDFDFDCNQGLFQFENSSNSSLQFGFGGTSNSNISGENYQQQQQKQQQELVLQNLRGGFEFGEDQENSFNECYVNQQHLKQQQQQQKQLQIIEENGINLQQQKEQKQLRDIKQVQFSQFDQFQNQQQQKIFQNQNQFFSNQDKQELKQQQEISGLFNQFENQNIQQLQQSQQDYQFEPILYKKSERLEENSKAIIELERQINFLEEQKKLRMLLMEKQQEEFSIFKQGNEFQNFDINNERGSAYNYNSNSEINQNCNKGFQDYNLNQDITKKQLQIQQNLQLQQQNEFEFF
ncbi:hypothetical protein PPERSA_10390 [Pseudocohnilembus persalinus]|uniref:Uncharacterized protein n=1 Tax=Pseudocohnilembus persalinus TaxID=266149 RepID=A0A0V0R2M4_PSEPJ|nr:hypothetical protein PPERSA_10390 [Pseudocohnilembus persalinus]|eukprot:KRX08586.1 hypothetical protein PPERSA_10390 [Pseudocohnilembus persalinus]